jgi:RecB family exonuclease
MRELAAAALRRPEGVHELLDELQPMAEIGPVELPEVLLVLRSHLRFLRREPGDERYGRVFVSSVEEARGMAFRLVFVPGLSEGTFPRPLFEDPLFGDAPRTGLGLRPRDRDEDEKGLLRLAAACAREVLTLSYARIDLLTGREKVPSFYAFDAMRAARGAPVEVRDFEREAAALTETRIGWPAPSDSCAAIDDAEYDLAVLRPAMEGKACDGLGAYLTAVNERLVRSLRARGRRWRPRWFASDGLVDLDVEALLALEEHRLGRRAYSPSALQQFAVCPYRFALRAVHQLYPAEAPAPLQRMDPLVRGELYHRAQFVLLRSLRQAGRLPVTAANVDLALAEFDRALDAVAAEFAERLAPAIESVWNAEVEALRADLRGWLQELDPDWTPAAFELSFGIEDLEAHDPASVAEPVDVLGLARLRGSIDLVERHPSGALRVTDHKTGAVPSPLPQLVGRGEVLQPILYALAAERILDGRVAFGRLYYSTVRQNYRRIDVPIQDFARERIAQVLRTIDDALDKGFLPAAPREDACRNCDYLPVCGPYEEERIRLKSRPELRPLFELRRMP